MKKINIKQFEPEDGWYKRDTKRVISHVVTELSTYDINQEVIEDVIWSIINAMRGEYGD